MSGKATSVTDAIGGPVNPDSVNPVGGNCVRGHWRAETVPFKLVDRTKRIDLLRQRR